jgi:hypothetical protein
MRAHRRSILAASVGIVVIGVGLAGTAMGSGDVQRPLLGPLAACPAGSPQSALHISTFPGSRFALTHACYYASAGVALRVTFSNLTVALDGSNPGPENLSIYRSREDAVITATDGIVVGPSTTARAVFRGSPVMVGDTISYAVPALAPGTYYLQSDLAPDRLFATLVVG